MEAQDLTKLTEATIQGELYHVCRNEGIPIILEMRVSAGFLDAAILNEERTHLVAIVECKSCKERCNPNSKQMQRYREIGTPVFILATMDGIPRLVERLKELDGGVSLEDVAKHKPTVPRRRRKARKPRVVELDEDLVIRA